MENSLRPSNSNLPIRGKAGVVHCRRHDLDHGPWHAARPPHRSAGSHHQANSGVSQEVEMARCGSQAPVPISACGRGGSDDGANLEAVKIHISNGNVEQRLQGGTQVGDRQPTVDPVPVLGSRMGHETQQVPLLCASVPGCDAPHPNVSPWQASQGPLRRSLSHLRLNPPLGVVTRCLR